MRHRPCTDVDMLYAGHFASVKAADARHHPRAYFALRRE